MEVIYHNHKPAFLAIENKHPTPHFWLLAQKEKAGFASGLDSCNLFYA
jgi:hypothetical protein